MIGLGSDKKKRKQTNKKGLKCAFSQKKLNILFVIWNGIFPPVYSGKLILSQTLTNPSFTQYGRLCANIHFHNKRPKYNMKSIFKHKNQRLNNVVN